MEFVIAHGSSKFLKSEKFAALKRQEKDSSPVLFKRLTVYCLVRLSRKHYVLSDAFQIHLLTLTCDIILKHWSWDYPFAGRHVGRVTYRSPFGITWVWAGPRTSCFKRQFWPKKMSSFYIWDLPWQKKLTARTSPEWVQRAQGLSQHHRFEDRPGPWKTPNKIKSIRFKDSLYFWTLKPKNHYHPERMERDYFTLRISQSPNLRGIDLMILCTNLVILVELNSMLNQIQILFCRGDGFDDVGDDGKDRSNPTQSLVASYFSTASLFPTWGSHTSSFFCRKGRLNPGQLRV